MKRTLAEFASVWRASARIGTNLSEMLSLDARGQLSGQNAILTLDQIERDAREVQQFAQKMRAIVQAEGE